MTDSAFEAAELAATPQILRSRSAARASTLALIRIGAAGISAFAVPAVFIRTYGRVGLGQWAVAQAVAAVVGFAELGVTASLARAAPRIGADTTASSSEVAAWRAIISYISMVSLAATAACVVWAGVVSADLFAAALLVAAINILVALFQAPFTAWLLGRGSPVLAYRAHTAGTVCRTAATLVPPIFHLSPWLLVAGAGGAGVVHLGMLMLAARQQAFPAELARPGRSWRAGLPHLRFGAAASVGTAAGLATQQTDKFLLGGLSGFASAGLFSAAASVSVAVWQLGSATHDYMYSFFVSAPRARERALDDATRVLSVLTVALPTAFALWLLFRGHSFFAWWIHVHDSKAVWALRYLTIAALLNLATSPVVIRLRAEGSVGVVAWAALWSFLVNIGLSLWWVRPLGAPGVAGASLLAEFVYLGTLIWYPASRRHLHCVRAALAAVLVVAVVGLSAAGLPRGSSIPADVISLGAALAACVVGALLLRDRLRRVLAPFDWSP